MARPDLRPNSLPWLVGKVLLTILFFWYLRMKVEGEEQVPSEGPMLLVSNHQSNLDPLAIGIACQREVCFLGKRELFKVPIVSYFIRQWGTIPIAREAADTSAMRAAVKVLRQGKILGIFPEGTRSTSGELRRFQEGAAKIALRFALPIIPVAIAGTGAAMPPRAWWIRPARVRVRFGKPFELPRGADQQPSPETLKVSADLIRERVAELMEAGGA